MKKVSLIISISVIVIITITACIGGNNTTQTKTNYKEVKIGKQIWMAENLNVDKFRNGDTILHAKSAEEWEKAGEEGKPAWCYYNNDSAIGAKYGKLYNWYAVNDPRGLAPEGWHVPTDFEWTLLTDFLGGEDFAGEKMKSTNGWENNGNGTNSSGFLGLPGGWRGYIGGFGDEGYVVNWWCSTKANAKLAWYRGLDNGDGRVYRDSTSMGLGFYVRCLKD